jgi:hypothetical protein
MADSATVDSIAVLSISNGWKEPIVVSKALSIGVFAAYTVMVAPPVANADRAEPAPIYGYYNALLDHSRQTFNGMPTPSDAAVQLGSFTTHCDVNGCVVHWLRETQLAENPNAPALYDYTWNNDRWESSGDYPYHCDPTGASGTVTAFRSDFLMPNGDGSFSGERTFTVSGSGCPGDGPGTYWLPISLTPVDKPALPR